MSFFDLLKEQIEQEQKLDAVLVLMKTDPGNWEKWSNEIQVILESATMVVVKL